LGCVRDSPGERLSRSERIAGLRISRLQAAAKPLGAHLRRTVGPGFRRHIPLCFPLQGVIADRCGRRKTFIHVSGLEQPAIPIRRMAPHAGEAVSLQFEAHRQCVDLFFRMGTLLEGTDTVRYSEQVLHMVADLMRDHVGLRKIAGSTETAVEFIEERQVQVELAVPGAVKGPGCRGGIPAGLRDSPGK